MSYRACLFIVLSMVFGSGAFAETPPVCHKLEHEMLSDWQSLLSEAVSRKLLDNPLALAGCIEQPHFIQRVACACHNDRTLTANRILAFQQEGIHRVVAQAGGRYTPQQVEMCAELAAQQIRSACR